MSALKQDWPLQVERFAVLPGLWKMVAVKDNLAALKEDWLLKVE